MTWGQPANARLLQLSAQAAPVRIAALVTRPLGSGVRDQSGGAAVVVPLPEEVTEAPGSVQLYPWVPLGLAGSGNNMQIAFFEAGLEGLLQSLCWVSAWL